MSLRRTLLLVGAVVQAAACGSTTEFSCDNDDQCTLSGAAGICTAQGQCAYPDAACDSGYAFPAGSSSGRAGECVLGEVAEGGSTTNAVSANGSATAVPGTTSTGSGEMDATNSSTATGDASVTDSSGGSSSGDDSSGSDTSATCRDEVGATPETAQPIPTCTPQIDGVVQDGDDIDVYRLGAEDETCVPATYSALVEGAIRACIVIACEGMTTPTVTCGGGASAGGLFGLLGCCSDGDLEAQLVCASVDGNGPGEVYVIVDNEAEAAVCEPYFIELNIPQ